MAEDFDVDLLRAAISQGRIHWHQHAFERLLERGITRAEIVRAIMDGEVVEVYAMDRPYQSCLMLNVEADPVHVVAAADPDALICHVITAYRPDLQHFEPDWKTRKKESS